MRKLATMRDALDDPLLLRDALPGESWAAWRILMSRPAAMLPWSALTPGFDGF
jgi:hypothetical protein